MSNTFTGDLLIAINEDGDYDINYENGQPKMTDGFDTAVQLAVFGEPDFWQNDITEDPNEKYVSEFPETLKNGTVSDKTIKDGIQALKKAMKFMTNIKACERVDVTGGSLSVFGLYWEIEIIRGNITNRYAISWDKGVTKLIRSTT